MTHEIINTLTMELHLDPHLKRASLYTLIFVIKNLNYQCMEVKRYHISVSKLLIVFCLKMITLEQNVLHYQHAVFSFRTH